MCACLAVQVANCWLGLKCSCSFAGILCVAKQHYLASPQVLLTTAVALRCVLCRYTEGVFRHPGTDPPRIQIGGSGASSSSSSSAGAADAAGAFELLLMLLKVKDWPPTKNFKARLPRHFMVSEPQRMISSYSIRPTTQAVKLQYQQQCLVHLP